MKRTTLMFSSLMLILAFLVLPTSVFAQSKAATHAHIHLASCISSPSDGNCDNQSPSGSGCWSADGRLIHTSGWTASNGTAMDTDLYRSNKCLTVWSVTRTQNFSNYDFRAGVTNVNDNHGWWTGYLTVTSQTTNMAYTNGESAFGEATDGINGTLHTTPTYPF